jgi:hypothetical protein
VEITFDEQGASLDQFRFETYRLAASRDGSWPVLCLSAVLRQGLSIIRAPWVDRDRSFQCRTGLFGPLETGQQSPIRSESQLARRIQAEDGFVGPESVVPAAHDVQRGSERLAGGLVVKMVGNGRRE